MEAGEAVVYYLGHSGWGVKTREHLLIFDYPVMGRRSDQLSLCNGHIDPAQLAGENVIVFMSHEHGDHFDPAAFEWRAQLPGITYVCGFRPQNATGYEYIPPRETRTIGGAKVTTIAANDSGEGFLVEVDGLTLFHAGDHANRNRDLSGNYKPEIEFLTERGAHPDLAFLPITGCNFGDQVAVKIGTEYALDTLRPKFFFPSHGGLYGTRYSEFIHEIKGNHPQTQMAGAECQGDRFVYKKGKLS